MMDFLFMIAGVLVLFLLGAGDLLADIVEDRQNRNDRGKLKKPSDKHVC